MPYAIPLGPTQHYVQIGLIDRAAPRSEPLQTTEVRGKKRYGVGRQYRLGRLGVGVGRWTVPPTPDEVIEHDLALVSWPRLVNPDEVSQLRERFNETTHRKLREGWTPPVWHWRRWVEWVLPLLVNLDVANADAYAFSHWQTPRWWPQWLRRNAEVGWRPMTVAEDLPEVQEDDRDALGL